MGDFSKRLLTYPSPLTVALQGTVILLITSWLNWVVFFISITITLFQFVKQLIKAASETTPPPPPSAVFITGASTGIGAALAVKYAKMGSQTIYITGRSKLDQTIASCQAAATHGSFKVVPVQVDVNDVETMRSEMQKADDATPLVLVIANAGISPEQQKHKPQESIYRDTYGTNITGVINTIFPMYDRFVARKRGHFVLVSSIASFGNIAHPAYSSSKACITTLGQGLRRDLRAANVNVTVVCPGFVESNMTIERHKARKGGLPFFQTQDALVDVMYTGVQNNIDVIVFPFVMHLLAYPVLRSLPYFIQDYIALLLAKIAYRAPEDSPDNAKPPTTTTTQPTSSTTATITASEAPSAPPQESPGTSVESDKKLD